jgi:hypothetical protein
MKRLVVIATTVRGAVEPHEELDGNGQSLAFEKMWAERDLSNSMVWEAEAARESETRAADGAQVVLFEEAA